jgi:hypothetical protein
MNKTTMLEVTRQLGAQGGRIAAKRMTKAQRIARAREAAAASAKVRSAKAKGKSKLHTPFVRSRAAGFRTFHQDLMRSATSLLELAFSDRRTFSHQEHNHLTAHGPGVIVMAVTAFDTWLSEVTVKHRMFSEPKETELLLNRRMVARYSSLYGVLQPGADLPQTTNLRIATEARHEIIHHFHGRPEPGWVPELESKGLLVVHPHRTTQRADSDWDLTAKLSSYALAYWVCMVLESYGNQLVKGTDDAMLTDFARNLGRYRLVPSPNDLPHFAPGYFAQLEEMSVGIRYTHYSDPDEWFARVQAIRGIEDHDTVREV